MHRSQEKNFELHWGNYRADTLNEKRRLILGEPLFACLADEGVGLRCQPLFVGEIAADVFFASTNLIADDMTGESADPIADRMNPQIMAAKGELLPQYQHNLLIAVFPVGGRDDPTVNDPADPGCNDRLDDRPAKILDVRGLVRSKPRGNGGNPIVILGMAHCVLGLDG